MREMLNKYGFLIACLLVSIECFAQFGPPCPTFPDCPDDPPSPPGLPIDGGVLVLLVLGLLFGFYKIYIFTVKKERSV